MKKILLILLSSVLLMGCSTTPKKDEGISDKDAPVVNETYSVLAPKGAPALALVSDFANTATNKYDLVDGSDLLTTELARNDSTYDLIIAPINLGAKLNMAKKTTYKLAGILTWGNLYLVGTKPIEELKDETITAFGESSVPGMVFKACLENAKLTNEVTYYGAATEAQAEILSGKTNYALLAEPAVSATIAKAKANGIELSVVWDIQKEFENISGTYGYPQAGIFVKEASYTKNPASMDAYLDALSTHLNDSMEIVRTNIDKVGADTLGLPSTDMAIKSYAGQNIKFGKGTDYKKELKAFLDLFQITFDDTLFLK